MTRLTGKNILKIVLVVIFWVFISFLVLVIGLFAKRKKVIIEGAIYGAAFILAMASPVFPVIAFVGIGSMVTSAIRAYVLRDLWLPRKGTAIPAQEAPRPVMVAPLPQYQAPAVILNTLAPDERSVALTWVSSQAKQNKHRLPGGAYVTILETCQLLDSVIDAELRQPSGDARFEYELDAMSKEYLPSVLQGFLAIPPNMVDNVQPNGRTPNDELVEQLQLLSRQAESLHSTRHGQASSDLSSTGNFLRERFGHHQQGGFDFGIK